MSGAEPHGLTAVAPPTCFVGRNPPKRTLLAYSAEATASAAKAGRQGYGGYPPRIHPRLYTRGFLRRRVNNHDEQPITDSLRYGHEEIFRQIETGGSARVPRGQGADASADEAAQYEGGMDQRGEGRDQAVSEIAVPEPPFSDCFFAARRRASSAASGAGPGPEEGRESRLPCRRQNASKSR